MPEACFMCLDSTEYMRNGDQFPNRLLAEQEAANLLANAKIESNAENTVGFLVMGGAACTVYETLTADVDRIMASIARVSISGSVCHFIHGLLIASLALSHRTNPRAEKRIVVFVGSPVSETEAALDTLARKLRRDDVGVDIVAFGVDENVPLLENFVSRVNKQNNSRFLSVPRSGNLTDTLMSSPILGMSEDMMQLGGGGMDGGFGIDPSADPQLAMAIRMSMEEERQRQAAAAAGSASTASPPPPTTSTGGGNGGEAGGSGSTGTRSQALEDMAERDEENMSDEEMLQRAIQLSLQEAAHAHGSSSSTTTNANGTGSSENHEEERGSDEHPAQGTKDHENEEQGHSS